MGELPRRAVVRTLQYKYRCVTSPTHFGQEESKDVISDLFGSFGAAAGALPWTLAGGRASYWCLVLDIFSHVNTVVQQHLLLRCSRGAHLRQLLQAPPAAAPAVRLQASAGVGAARASMGGQEG